MLNSEAKKQEERIKKEYSTLINIICHSTMDENLLISALLKSWLEGRQYQLDKNL